MVYDCRQELHGWQARYLSVSLSVSQIIGKLSIIGWTERLQRGDHSSDDFVFPAAWFVLGPSWCCSPSVNDCSGDSWLQYLQPRHHCKPLPPPPPSLSQIFLLSGALLKCIQWWAGQGWGLETLPAITGSVRRPLTSPLLSSVSSLHPAVTIKLN